MKITTAAMMLAAALLMLAGGAAAAEKKEYTVGIHFESGAGVSSSRMFEFTQALLKLIMEESGYKIRLDKFSSLEDVRQAFVENRIDAAFLYPPYFLKIMDEGVEIYPYVTYTVKKRRKMAMCLWQRKTDETKDLSGVVGRTIIGSEFTDFDLALLREFLNENGMDKPLWRVFKSFTKVPGGNSAFMALAMGDADFYWAHEDNDAYLKLLTPNLFAELTHVFCTGRVYSRNAIFFNVKTVKEEDSRKFTKSMEQVLHNFSAYVKKDPNLQAVGQYMKLSEVKFITAAPDEFEHDLKLYRKAKKNGWLEEANLIVEKMKAAPMGKAMEIKMNFKDCKKWCAGAKDQMACVDECMK